MTSGPEPQEERPVSCPYCKAPMTVVVLGWHCAACHASIGQSRIVKKK